MRIRSHARYVGRISSATTRGAGNGLHVVMWLTRRKRWFATVDRVVVGKKFELQLNTKK